MKAAEPDAKLTDAQNRHNASLRKIKALQKQLRSAQTGRDLVREEYTRVKAEKDHAAMQLSALQSTHKAACDRLAEVSERLRKVESENRDIETLRMELTTLDDVRQAYALVTRKARTLQEELDALRAAKSEEGRSVEFLDALKQAHTATLHRLCASNEELNRFRSGDEIRSLHARIADTEAAIEELDGDNQSLRAENDALRQQLEAIRVNRDFQSAITTELRPQRGPMLADVLTAIPPGGTLTFEAPAWEEETEPAGGCGE